MQPNQNNPERNNQSNQNHENNEKQHLNENQADNGLELLKKVIESNEENIELMVNFSGNVEDLANIVGHLESTMRTANYNIKVLDTIKDEFLDKFNKLIGQIPQKHYMDFSEKSISTLDKFDERLTKFENETEVFKKHKKATYSMLGFAALIIILCFYFSKQFYQTSIQTKMEIRAELLQEIKNDKKEIYDKNEVEQLQSNIEVMNKWIDAYPKEGKEFLRFKKGFESK